MPPFTFRPGTVDRLVFEQVAVYNEYRLPDRMAGAVVLDVGAHIGSFAYACAARGAAEVWCVEAEPGNCALLRQNLGRLLLPGLRCVLFGAAWRSDRPAGTVRVRAEGFNTGHALVTEGDGAEVPALPFDQLVGLVTDGGRRRIGWLKLDCEGSEFPILFTTRRLGLVDRVCGEYHLAEAHRPLLAVDGHEAGRAGLRRRLEAEGFAVELTEPDGDGLGHFWAHRPDDDTTPIRKGPQ